MRVRLGRPVLDAFAHDEKVGLDQSLDDLTVPLLPGGQPAGGGQGLLGRGGGQGKCLGSGDRLWAR